MNSIFKPSFEINFWMKHFCGYSTQECRSYESFLDQPIAETMFFADTFDDYEDDITLDYTEILGPFVKKQKTMEDLLEGLEIDMELNENKDTDSDNYYEDESDYED